MVLMDSISSQALSVREVKHETNALYADALNNLRGKGVEIQSMVCGGRKGLLQLFPEIPAQLYQFHQVKTVSRYLTRSPKTAACKALWQLALTLKGTAAKWPSRAPCKRGLNSIRVFSTNGRSMRKAAGRTLHAQAAEECVFEPETKPRLSVHL